MDATGSEQLFAHCPDQIKKQIIYQSVKKGEILTLQDQEEEFVYIILQGSAKVYNIFPNGTVFQINVFYAVDFIGEMEVFLEGGAFHMAEANEDSYMAKLSKSAFAQWVHEDATLCFLLLQHTQQRLADLSRRFKLLRQLSSSQRLYAALFQHKEAQISKRELQDEIAVSPRTLNRLLQKEVDKGVVAVHNGFVEILRPDVIKAKSKNFRDLLPSDLRETEF